MDTRAVYAELQRLPASARGLLEPEPGTLPVPAARIGDSTWLREQVMLPADRWGTGDRHVLATLWFYSASHFLVTPTAASLVVAGHALSPALPDLVLHQLPDGRVTGTQSARAVGADLDRVSGALREMLGTVIDAVAAYTDHGVRPLWALATDGLANRLLFFGEAIGAVDRATDLAHRVTSGIGVPLPPARYVEVGTRRFVERVSCCLLYRVPGQEMCISCPRRHPDERGRLLCALSE